MYFTGGVLIKAEFKFDDPFFFNQIPVPLRYRLLAFVYCQLLPTSKSGSWLNS